jgi:hypothetical protein
MRENTFFSTQTQEVYEYFESWLFSYSENKTNDGNKKSIYCDLYDFFYKKEIDSNKSDSKNYHNCIGCNFEEGCFTILDYLRRFSGSTSISPYLTIYSLLFYHQAERLAVIYKELRYTSGKNFDWVSFPTLRTIKHWANFFKHPKAYMFLHHPSYFIETDPEKPNFLIQGIINTDFVDNFYKASADNTQLLQLFENGKKFKIFYPDLLQLTKDLCTEFSNIIPIIKLEKNADKLRKYTIDNFE